MRMASASAMDYRQILNETVANLYFLETIFDRTNEPSLPWKTKHELNDMAVIRLAEVFEGRTNSSPSVTRHWERADRTGQFVDFVLKFYEHMLPDFASTVSGRSIQASLEKRALWSQD